MNKHCVTALVLWIRRIEQMQYATERMTLESLFQAAYVDYYERVVVETKFAINCDMEDFEKLGVVPVYVVRFMQKVVYPTLRR